MRVNFTKLYNVYPLKILTFTSYASDCLCRPILGTHTSTEIKTVFERCALIFLHSKEDNSDEMSEIFTADIVQEE